MSSARWLIPVLAVMSADGGSRFSVLARALGMSPSVLSRHLDLLESFGWIDRNPGHGHPLRPEYVLTAAGRPIGAWCEAAMRQRSRLGLEQTDLGRWSLPIAFELRDEWRRFSELERGLEPITPRALSLALTQMVDVELVVRHPVQPRYGLTSRGEHFASALMSG